MHCVRASVLFDILRTLLAIAVVTGYKLQTKIKSTFWKILISSQIFSNQIKHELLSIENVAAKCSSKTNIIYMTVTSNLLKRTSCQTCHHSVCFQNIIKVPYTLEM